MTKTLLIDGNNLLKIGVNGVKDFYHNGKHVGGIWHFLNTVRRLVYEHNFDKVVVFWDGENNSAARQKIYPQYKGRKRPDANEFKEESFYEQLTRVKQYLEEVFIRQVEISNNEADDLIAYYCLISKDEHKTIASSDVDLTQLISDRVSIYSLKTKTTYGSGDKIPLKYCEIPHNNVLTYKILCGDKSDNIFGIMSFGEKTMIKYFPDILEKDVTISDILNRAKELLDNNKKSAALNNLISGKTKLGEQREEFFRLNTALISLRNPMITEDAKALVMAYYSEDLDPEGRGYKNLIKMMIEDGLFKFLPKTDDAWVDFLKPFLKLTRKEKRNQKHN